MNILRSKHYNPSTTNANRLRTQKVNTEGNEHHFEKHSQYPNVWAKPHSEVFKYTGIQFSETHNKYSPSPINHKESMLSAKKWDSSKDKQNLSSLYNYKSIRGNSEIGNLELRDGLARQKALLNSRREQLEKQNLAEMFQYNFQNGKNVLRRQEQRIFQEVIRSNFQDQEQNRKWEYEPTQQKKVAKREKILKHYANQCKSHMQRINSHTSRNEQSAASGNTKQKCPTYQKQLNKFREEFGRQTRATNANRKSQTQRQSNLLSSQAKNGIPLALRDSQSMNICGARQELYKNQPFHRRSRNRKGSQPAQQFIEDINLRSDISSQRGKATMGIKCVKQYIASQYDPLKQQQRIFSERRRYLQKNTKTQKERSPERMSETIQAIAFTTHSQSLIGSKKKNNQDSVTTPCSKGSEQFPIWIVCDGHGENGHQVSWYVSNLMHELTFETLKKNNGRISRGEINDIFRQTKKCLQETAIDISLSGTTCVMVIAVKQETKTKLICASLGDSTAMLVFAKDSNSIKSTKSLEKKRWSGGYNHAIIHETADQEDIQDQEEVQVFQVGKNQMSQAKRQVSKEKLFAYGDQKYKVISKEHKPGNEEEKQRIVFYGGSVHKHPSKKNMPGTPLRLWGTGNDNWGPGLAVSRAFGDKMAQKYGLICEPTIEEVEASKELKHIVMGSDGLFDQIPPVQVASLLIEGNPGSSCAQKCAMLAQVAHRRWAGYADDVSVVLVSF